MLNNSNIYYYNNNFNRFNNKSISLGFLIKISFPMFWIIIYFQFLKIPYQQFLTLHQQNETAKQAQSAAQETSVDEEKSPDQTENKGTF